MIIEYPSSLTEEEKREIRRRIADGIYLKEGERQSTPPSNVNHWRGGSYQSPPTFAGRQVGHAEENFIRFEQAALMAAWKNSNKIFLFEALAIASNTKSETLCRINGTAAQALPVLIRALSDRSGARRVTRYE